MKIQTIKKLLLIDECEDEDRTPRTVIQFKKGYTKQDMQKIKNFNWNCFDDFIELIKDNYLVEEINFIDNKEINYDYCIYY